MAKAVTNKDFHIKLEPVEMLKVLSAEGKIVNEDMDPKLSDDQLREIMRRMVFTRAWDKRAVNTASRTAWLLCSGIGTGSVDDCSAICLDKGRFYLPGLSRHAADRLARLCRCIKRSYILAAISMAVKFRKALMYSCRKLLSVHKLCRRPAWRWASN